MQRRTKLMALLGAAVAVSVQVMACNPASLITIPPQDLNLAGARLSTFSDLEAGVPKRLQGSFTAPDVQGFRLTGGFDILPESVTLTPSDTSSEKGSRAAQLQVDIPTCVEACSLAGVDDAACTLVCEERQIQVTVWVGALEAIEADCTDGDEYVFLVTLDEDGAVTGVTVSPTSFQSQTEDLLNAGADTQFGVCVEVIAPVSGEVIVSSLRMNLGIK